MAKKKLMSAKARALLKITAVFWFVMVLLLILGIGTGETTRTVPEYRKVTVDFRLPEGEGKAVVRAYRDAFIETEYLAAEEITVGGHVIAKGTPLGAEQFAWLEEAGFTGPLVLRDPKPLRDLANAGVHAVRDIPRSVEDYKKKVETDENAADLLLVKEGDKIDFEKVKALVAYNWAGEKIEVKGEDKIVGVNLTLPFVAINFLFLVAILYGLLWEPMLKMLDDRAEKIRTDIESAEKDRADAEQLKVQYDGQLAKINQERTALIERGKKEGYDERTRIVTEARAEAEAIVASAKAETEASVEKAKQQLMKQISEYATTIAGQIIQREISADDHRVMVNQFVAEMDKTQLN